MSVKVYNKEPLALVNYMDTYFKEKPPDCSLISKEGHEMQIHKELLYQTKFMQTMVKSANLDCCNCKIEILCPIVKEDLEMIVNFLCSGKISCKNETECSEVLSNLTQLFGFPSIDLKEGGTITWPVIKDEIQEPPDIVPQFVSNSLDVEVKPVKTDNVEYDDMQTDDIFGMVSSVSFCFVF